MLELNLRYTRAGGKKCQINPFNSSDKERKKKPALSHFTHHYPTSKVDIEPYNMGPFGWRTEKSIFRPKEQLKS